ncbi:putative tRNA-i(6)A37 thiotransferase enzyme MiaB [Ancylostoma caninum]|uniref:Putative tRNA-i(6)A37 thiotransferase enzyme MiaB n=1 Tax=Ancylostoma caninum TaxID=29170 RepID=A0A368GTV0_ANCCA|nr:putative tRNA-i(6)A37 thiotransferase enzyme MiaB [Ancylostoma caninum]
MNRRFLSLLQSAISRSGQRYACEATATTAEGRRRTVPNDGLGLDHFIQKSRKVRLPKISPTVEESSYLDPLDISGLGRKVKYVTYGCQMNVNDMEVVRSILKSNDYVETDDLVAADVVVLITCSIREGAEDKVWRELKRIKHVARRKPVVGVLGCMAERVRHGLLSKKGLVDVVAGPDAYRDLPRLLAVARAGSSAINVQLSVEETYADVRPVRVDENARTAFVSIMRGCDNMCTYCVVPLTRGRERSRPIDSIIDEVRRLSDEASKSAVFSLMKGPKTGGRTFLTLLDKISEIDPEMRIRFTSPHPKDFPIEVIQLIKERPNICNQLHLPAQSGDDVVLERMGRGYTRDLYLKLVDDIRRVLPDVSLTSDFIAGFCGETEEAHRRTVELIRSVKYTFCYVFPYSMREKTRAHYRLVDDVAEEVKRQRHEELAAVFREESLAIHQSLIGTEQVVLVEGNSKRSPSALQGRADSGTKVIFENIGGYEPGDYVVVRITGCSSQTMQGESLRKTTLKEFYD